LGETEAADDGQVCHSENPAPLCQQNNNLRTVVSSIGAEQGGRDDGIDLGCTTSTVNFSPGFAEGVGRSTDLAPGISSAVSGSQAHQSGPSCLESPTRDDEDWTTHGTIPLANDASVNIGRLPNHALSPSISSGYHIEDGIFEHGSAYQNLFQSLRSQVFRTAQFESETLDENLRWRSGDLSGHDNANSFPAADGEGGIYTYKHAAEFQTFELPLTQEYLLWKAWTEEVSIWVRPQNPERVALD